jgi:ribosomal protein L37E
MALVECRGCGVDVSETADSCPSCGFRVASALRWEKVERVSRWTTIAAGLAFILLGLSPITDTSAALRTLSVILIAGGVVGVLISKIAHP